MGNDSGDLIGNVIKIVVITGIPLFIILREVACWYWKINDWLTTLQNIESTLDKRLEEISDLLKMIVENKESINAKTILEVPIIEDDNIPSFEEKKLMIV